MLTPIIISYDCLEYDPIDQWQPQDPHNINISINFTIGIRPPSGDNFILHIVTPNNLELLNRYSLVIDAFDLKKILTHVHQILEKCKGDDWQEISNQLSQFFEWEFENYRP
jgi:hypothetical protein